MDAQIFQLDRSSAAISKSPVVAARTAASDRSQGSLGLAGGAAAGALRKARVKLSITKSRVSGSAENEDAAARLKGQSSGFSRERFIAENKSPCARNRTNFSAGSGDAAAPRRNEDLEGSDFKTRSFR
jgi:hypothetical protein